MGLILHVSMYSAVVRGVYLRARTSKYGSCLSALRRINRLSQYELDAGRTRRCRLSRPLDFAAATAFARLATVDRTSTSGTY